MSDAIKINDFLAGAADWRIVSDGAVAFFPTGSLADSARFVDALAKVDGWPEHNFGIDLRAAGVTVRIVTLNDDLMGMTAHDLALANKISDLAKSLGLHAEPSQVQSLLVVPGAPNRAEVMPFWQAALGYVRRPDSPDEDLIDPHDRGPALWIEEMDEPRPGGFGAIHLAVWLPIEEAQARVDATMAAGGHLVRDDYAPAWWTLADKYGNEIDIATIAYRDGPKPGD